MKITKEIIDTINDMLEDDALSLEDGRIVDYRDAKVNIVNTECFQTYEGNSVASIIERVRFNIGKDDYKVVYKSVISNDDAWRTWQEENCRAALSGGYSYLLKYDMTSSSWLVCGRMAFSMYATLYERAEGLIHMFINSNLKMPLF